MPRRRREHVDRDTAYAHVRAVFEALAQAVARYAIVDHHGHSHLVYALELPRDLGEARRPLRIESEASYTEEERIHDAELFGALRVEPDELPLEPLRSGRLS